MNDYIELAVIGAGPAGLAAAATAARGGLQVALFDEQPAPGGQIFRAVEAMPETRASLLGADYRRGSELVLNFRASAAEYFPETSVWSISREREIGVLHNGKARLVQAGHVLIAGGAMERPIPFPGWTLPGVMNAGAGQILLKSAGIVPGDVVVLAGSGPLLLLLAWQYLQAGVKIKALLDVTPWRHWVRALPRLPSALLARHYLTRGLGYKLDLHRAGIREVYGVTGLRARGEQQLEAVQFRHRGADRSLETGLLLSHFGVIPNIQLTLATGCKHTWDRRQVCWRPVTDEWGNTSIPGISVSGDIAAIGGARTAEHAGCLAALEALRALGHIDAAQRDRRAEKDRHWMTADLRIRPFLDALYRPPAGMLAVPDDETIVCRCEEVTAGEIRQAALAGQHDINQVKFLTRCGMGPCQGRQCGQAVGHIVAAALGSTMETAGHYRMRPPVKPITLSQLAALEPNGASE